jgi:murein DD-endopeptidase MepM/ murein hydrolase activator NlpD
MFKNYQVVIFRDHHGTCRKLRFRGWLFAGMFAAMALMVAGDVYLVKYYYNYKRMQRELELWEKQGQDQNAQLLSLSDKVKTLETDLTRIRGFDAKLRQMVNLDQEPRDVAPMGADDKDFNKKYLPLYRQEMLTRKLHQFLSDLRENASLERIRQQELLTVLDAKGSRLTSMPITWPVEGWISSPFGERLSPFTNKKEFHKGMDIAAPLGTSVLAPGGGTVIFAGESEDGGFGVTIDHQGGVVTSYGHLRDVSVAKGQTVTRGQLLGHVGDAGQSTGPHLHYETRLGGVPVNPTRYILE